MEPIENLNKLSGRIACKGKAEGLARVINHYDDLDRIKEGDILIASQTDMNYSPYLQKCRGLITEMGGRYCHAAIYSRENNLPCITNVQNAKKIIKDESFIILDADRNEIYEKNNSLKKILTNLEDIDISNENIGEKIKNLFILSKNGINIPKGFVLSNEVYFKFIEPIKDELLSILAEKNPEKSSKLIQDLFLSKSLEGLKESLDETLKVFDDDIFFAVRSSGFCYSNGDLLIEDSDNKSLAGQFESYLKVPKGGVEDAIKLCWSSLYNCRSLKSFHINSNNEYINSSMSVIIQEMIQAEYCAVMMTKDPLDERRVFGIESTYGSCEAIVSGKITGDLILCDRVSKKIIEKEIGKKTNKIVYSVFSKKNFNNQTLEPISNNLINLFALNEEKIKELVNTGLRIESLFGKPQDIEAVFSKEKLYILQTRNITTI
jgi:rifampicin phosphotransferase